MSENPYEPPKPSKSPKRELDEWNETIHNDPDTDWGEFIFIMTVFVIIVFHPLLIDLVISLFKAYKNG